MGISRGLNKWAQQFVTGEQVYLYRERVVRIFPDGREETCPDQPVYVSSVKKELNGSSVIAFGEKYILAYYMFSNGQIFHEVLQETPWSGIGEFYLALADERGTILPESRWSPDQIRVA